MAFVIAETCIDVKDGDCTNVCPVECIYEGGRMYYIQPDECVNCGICVSVCPVEAIFDERALPEKVAALLGDQPRFLRTDDVTGLGRARWAFSHRNFVPGSRSSRRRLPRCHRQQHAS